MRASAQRNFGLRIGSRVEQRARHLLKARSFRHFDACRAMNPRSALRRRAMGSARSALTESPAPSARPARSCAARSLSKRRLPPCASRCVPSPCLHRANARGSLASVAGARNCARTGYRRSTDLRSSAARLRASGLDFGARHGQQWASNEAWAERGNAGHAGKTRHTGAAEQLEQQCFHLVVAMLGGDQHLARLHCARAAARNAHRVRRLRGTRPCDVRSSREARRTVRAMSAPCARNAGSTRRWRIAVRDPRETGASRRACGVASPERAREPSSPRRR